MTMVLPVKKLGRRVGLSVKVRPSLKKEFLALIKQEGLSTCVVIEALLSGWIEGLKAQKKTGYDQSHSITVVQNFKRVVTRARRSYKEEGPAPNFYSPVIGWFYKSDEELNSNFHAFGCQCSVCR